MLLLKTVLWFLFVKLVISSPQINVHLTDWGRIKSSLDNNIQHDCIYLSYFDKNVSSRHVIPYCLSEWTLNNVSGNVNNSSVLTFNQLRKQNITSDDLLSWSATIDTIESYQFYLYDLNPSLSERLFYNCTFPYFGGECQYTFDFDISSYSSLNQLIDHYYEEQVRSESKISTCYTHLECHHNLQSICLDWSEICDGKIDCEGGIDEEHCSELTFNQCKDEEYQCNNGQCIPNIFVRNGYDDVQCLDQSDESVQHHSNLPISSNEDIICSWRQNHSDKHGKLTPFSSSCQFQRHMNIRQTIFSEISNSMFSNDCLLAIRCHTKISSNDQSFCSQVCANDTCIHIIEQQCPERFFYPSIPIAFNHIYFLYTNEYLTNWTTIGQIPPEYICYDHQLCRVMSSKSPSLIFSNKTCHRLEDFPVSIDSLDNDWYSGYIRFAYSQFAYCNPPIALSDRMYQCRNSSRYIPHSYLGDKVQDCPYADDEEQQTIDAVCLANQRKFFFQCQTDQKCIHRNEVEDGICQCQIDQHQMCEDENRLQLTFPSTCDGLVDLRAVEIEGQEHNDETECQYWPCNNIYTRCNGIIDCEYGDDEQICNSTWTNLHNRNSMTSPFSGIDASKFYCQRGLPLRVLIDGERNLSSEVCLCPPQYYGDRCQYQNERISLTIQVNPSRRSEQTALTCLVSLIDDSDEQMVHSYEQFSYFSPRDEQTKFNMYFLYSNRPKDSRRRYAMKIDIYGMYTLLYRDSIIIPIKHSFLPVQRLALQLDLPQTSDTVQTCQSAECIHGQCIRSLNEPSTVVFCQCQSGWTGKSCNVSHLCDCAPYSLCAGLAANGRSICVCPVDYFGPRCALIKSACADSPCRNGGFCLPSDAHMPSDHPSTCICPEGFSGERCEILDTEIFLTFPESVPLPSRSLVYFHLVSVVDHLTNIQEKNPLIVCGNESQLSSSFPSKFQLTFLELNPFEYYFLATQNQTSVLHRTIQPADRCSSITELFNETILRLPAIRRIKHYHLPCRNLLLNLSCFYDETYMCLCSATHRFAECFQFNHQLQIDDLYTYQWRIDQQCPTFNQSTSSVSLTSFPTSISAAYVDKYSFYLFGLMLCLHALYTY